VKTKLVFIIFVLFLYILLAKTSYTTYIPEVNFKHLVNLSREIKLGGEEVLVIYTYADAPDYKPVEAQGEGFTCVDDVARFAVVALLNAERTHSKDVEEMAYKALKFVLAMQDRDGQFYNFLKSDLTINKEGETSYKGHGWWAIRALWALGAGSRYFSKKDPAFSERLIVAAYKLLPWYDKYLKQYGYYKRVDGEKLPLWLIQGGGDLTAEAILGMLELYKARPTSELAQKIGKFCDGISEFQIHKITSPLYCAHPSNINEPYLWHAWGSRQTMALARASEVLSENPHSSIWLKSAQEEADVFFKHLLDTHIPEVINNKNITPYPQIAYGVNSIILGCLEIYRATGDKHYLDMALRAFSWYTGENSAKVKMYDEQTGRCFDGITGEGAFNCNSGAESTIEALLVIEELKREVVIHKH